MRAGRPLDHGPRARAVIWPPLRCARDALRARIRSFRVALVEASQGGMNIGEKIWHFTGANRIFRHVSRNDIGRQLDGIDGPGVDVLNFLVHGSFSHEDGGTIYCCI